MQTAIKQSAARTPVVLPRIVVALLLGLSLIGMPGCVAVVAGAGAAGAVAYVRGELEANLDHNYESTVEATRRAISELGFAQISEKKDALAAVFVARTALDKKIEIRLANPGNRLTNIKIRVGVFGDEQLSLSILDKIKAGF